jgi:hypothetical protein
VHAAIKNAQQLLDKNAELAARLQVSEEQIRARREQNERLKSEASRQSERAVLLEEEVRWFKTQVFGRSAEHSALEVSPDQQMLFNEAEVLAAIEAADAAHAKRSTPIPAHERRHTGGRKVIPKQFPRQEITHDLSEAQNLCQLEVLLPWNVKSQVANAARSHRG